MNAEHKNAKNLHDLLHKTSGADTCATHCTTRDDYAGMLIELKKVEARSSSAKPISRALLIVDENWW